ncbi:MAG: LysM peptidoglycan-binding domain-containing protein [Chlamydiae bacterium]|nr:LysM peptidoglycan-binding domain-containing protein [Chlamydiota bacterium]
MDRKKTIMITVMINAGLLAVLFIAAVTMREKENERDLVPQKQVGVEEQKKPLYGEVLEITPSAETQEKFAAPIEPSPTFVLPPVAAESSPIVLPEIKALSTSLTEVVVQKGDTLEKIARKHHLPVDDILKANGLSSSFLKEGQRLKIPEAKVDLSKTKTRPLPVDQAEYYTMKVGDNPWSIAMKYHMKVDELLRLNGLNEKTARKLKPGDRLRVK